MSAPAPNIASADRTQSPRGFTLIEMVVALAITSILMVAIGSSMLLASRALPHEDAPETMLLEADRALEQFASELTHALQVSEWSETAITFTVADRTGDGAAQRVRYAWSGTAGDPLTRQLDADPAVAVVDAVQRFALAHEYQDVAETYPGPLVQDPEERLDYYSSLSSLSTYRLQPGRALGQVITTPTASDMVAWYPTRAFVHGLRAGSSGTKVAMQIRLKNLDDQPAEPLAETLISDSSFGRLVLLLFWEPTWESVNFTTNERILPGEPSYLTAAHHNATGTSIDVYYSTLSAKGGLIYTVDGGATWPGPGLNAMPFYLYGHVLREGAARTARRRHLSSVGISLALRDTPELSTRVALLNRPAQLTRRWRLDFKRNPTSIDLDADGETDWTLHAGSTLSDSQLSAGVWRASQWIRTAPAHNFNKLTTINARLRATGAGTVGVTAHVDATTSYVAPILAQLTRAADGTQSLVVLCHDAVGNYKIAATVPNLPDRFIDLRLLIDPATGTLNVRVDDVDKGTERYYRIGIGSRIPGVAIGGDAGEFEQVVVAVGEAP